MKKTIIAMTMLAIVGVIPAFAQSRGVVPEGKTAQELRMYRGVGPVVKGSTDVSSLPAQAQSFLQDLFPGATVSEVDNDYADRQYEVEMSNGYEVTFNYQGDWLEVEAPAGATLPSSTLTALVPEEVVLTTIGSDALLTGGATDVVDDIEVTPQGYIVEYVTGTVGRGKANINKSDGSIMLRDKKSHRSGGCKAGHARLSKKIASAAKGGHLREAVVPVSLAPGR